MNTPKTETKRATARDCVRRFVGRLMAWPEGTSLITVWKIKESEQALGQKIYKTEIRVGRFKIIRWQTVYTPISDWK